MFKHMPSLLIAVVLVSATFAVSASPDQQKTASVHEKESCDQCMTRQKEICASTKSACELRAKAAALRYQCGANQDCAAAAKEAFDQELLACGQEEDVCNSGATAKCRQCKPDAETEPCETCVSRQEKICGYREAACKAMARAEYYIDLYRCRPDNNRCIPLMKQAYDESAMACVSDAQACGLRATDGCSRCRFVEPPGRARKRR